MRENLGPEDTSVDEAERKKVMELLWRLETGEGVIDDDDDGADEDDNDDNEEQNVSVENRKRVPGHPLTEDIPVDQLLRMLTIKERDRFAMLLRHPEQAAKIYFTDAQDVSSPWWVSSTTHGARPWEHVSSYTPFACLARAETQVDLRFHLMYLWYVDGPHQGPRMH